MNRLGIFEPRGEVAEDSLSVPHVEGLVPGDAVVVEGHRDHGGGGEKEEKRAPGARHVESREAEYSPWI
jgi:hypothetical protein